MEERREATVFGKIPVTASHGILFLEIAQIVYAETDGHGCVVHTTSKSYEVNQLLGELEKKLADFGFFRIHKSYLVNLDYVVEMVPGFNNGYSLKMKYFEKERLPIGRTQVKEFRNLFFIS